MAVVLRKKNVRRWCINFFKGQGWSAVDGDNGKGKTVHMQKTFR